MSKLPLFTYRNTIALGAIDDIVDIDDSDDEPKAEEEKPITTKKRKRKNIATKKSTDRHEDKVVRKKKKKKHDADADHQPTKRSQSTKVIVIEDESIDSDELSVLDAYKTSSALEDFEGEDERESLLMQSLQAIRNVQHKVSNLSHTLSRTTGMSNTVPLAVSVCEDAANVRLFVESNTPQKFRLKFTVRRDGPLEVLLKILSHANNTPQSMICLKYDGIIVEPSKTPAECFMEDDDVLEYTIIDEPTKKNTEKHEQSENAQSLILEDPGPNDGDTNGLDILSPIKITESKDVTDEEDIALQLDRQIKETVEKKQTKRRRK